MKCENCLKDVPRTFRNFTRGFSSLCRGCISQLFPDEEFTPLWQGWLIKGEDKYMMNKKYKIDLSAYEFTSNGYYGLPYHYYAQSKDGSVQLNVVVHTVDALRVVSETGLKPSNLKAGSLISVTVIEEPRRWFLSRRTENGWTNYDSQESIGQAHSEFYDNNSNYRITVLHEEP